MTSAEEALLKTLFRSDTHRRIYATGLYGWDLELSNLMKHKLIIRENGELELTPVGIIIASVLLS